MFKNLIIVLCILLLPMQIYAKNKEKSAYPFPKISWDAGIKGCIDTANIRLEEDPYLAFGTYACGGQTLLFENNEIFRWNAGLGYSTYAGYEGFVTAAASYGYVFYPTNNPDFLLSVLGTIDFQTYCYKTLFFALGCDAFAKHYVYDNIGFYADLGLFYDYSFDSFMPKMEFGVSFR